MRVKLNHEDGIINGIIILQNEVFKLQKWSVIFGSFKIVLLFVQKSMMYELSIVALLQSFVPTSYCQYVNHYLSLPFNRHNPSGSLCSSEDLNIQSLRMRVYRNRKANNW